MANSYQSIVYLANLIHKEMGIDETSPMPVNIYHETEKSIQSVIMDFTKNDVNHSTVVKIETRKTPFVNDEVYGFYRRKENTNTNTSEIIISILKRLPPEWDRFVEAKELSHILMDNEESSYTHNLDDLITYLLAEQPTFRIDDDMASEHLAMYFSTELLIPYCFNDMLFQNDISNLKLANIFKVPVRTIEIVKSTWYQKRRNNAYEDLNIEHETITT